jgi:O-antigen ligase
VADDPLNRVAQYLGLSMLFLTFSVLPQIIGYVTGVNFFLLYLIGVPALLATVLSGGLRRSFRGRPAYYWTGFACWMLIATPFSSWPGGSAAGCLDYWKSSLIMLFIVAGLIFEWRDVKKVMTVIAVAGVVDLFIVRMFRLDSSSRVALSFGTIGNSNDYAAHLLLVMPFLLWIALTGKLVLRIGAALCLAAGLYLILATASRGALVSLAVDALAVAILGTARQRIGLALIGPLAAVILLATVPTEALQRMSTVWNKSISTAQAASAGESADAREYVLRTSIRYTFEHPLFGVGLREFANYEGRHEQVIGGVRGYWHETHNSYTQVASECGIPALLLFASGIISTFLLLRKTLKEARRRPGCQDIRNAVFCILLGMIGFCTAITFLSFAYYFYLPALGGLATGVWFAAQREFQRRDELLQVAPIRNPVVNLRR